jgi:predicted nucleic acid-binding protein
LCLADAYLAAAALEVGPAVVASLDADLDTVEGIVRIAS